MKSAELQLTVRPMTLSDLNEVFSIHQKITAVETSVTYKGFTVRQIFGMNIEEADSAKRSNILGEVAKLIDLGFLAYSEGRECGFVMGRQTYLAEYDTQVGEIAVIGVLPGYRGKGIATKLINSICELFRSRGVYIVRIGIDPLDKDLLTFFEREGFSGQRLLYYSKTL